MTALVEPTKPEPKPEPKPPKIDKFKLPYDIYEINSIINPGEVGNCVEIFGPYYKKDGSVKYFYKYKKRIDNKYEQHWWFYGVREKDVYVIQTEKHKNVWLKTTDDGKETPFLDLLVDSKYSGKSAYKELGSDDNLIYQFKRVEISKDVYALESMAKPGNYV